MSSFRDNFLDKDKSKISQTLLELGLTNEEVNVYLACLKSGSKPASLIAKTAGYKRGHTYNLLEALTERGLIQEFLRNNIRQFVAQSPSMLTTLIENKEREVMKLKLDITEILPLIEKLSDTHINKPKIRFFRGEEGLKSIYESTLQEKDKTIYAIGDFASTFPKKRSDILHKWMWNYAARRAKAGIWYYGIMNKSNLSDEAFKKRQIHKRKMKMLEGVEFATEVNIYGNKVAVASTAHDMSGVIIEDTYIANTLRNFHKAVWKFLPDYQ